MREPRSRRGNEAEFVGGDGFRLVTSAATRWFMGSRHLLLRMHLDHEPLGRDAFHRVRFFASQVLDAVKRVPTGS